MAVAHQIARLRKQKNISQAKLAEQVGVKPLTVCRWENGKAEPRLNILSSLVAALGISADDFLKGAAL